MIMVAPFDIFGRGLYRYTFEGVCRECPDLRLADGATRIFINTKGTNPQDFSQEFLDFMKYITESTDEVASQTDSERIKLIHKNVQKIRTSEKMGVKFMQKWEELAYAKLDGVAENLINNIEAVMENFNLDLPQACAGLNITVEEYYKAKEQLQNPMWY